MNLVNFNEYIPNDHALVVRPPRELMTERRDAYGELDELGELCNCPERARVPVCWSTNGPDSPQDPRAWRNWRNVFRFGGGFWPNAINHCGERGRT